MIIHNEYLTNYKINELRVFTSQSPATPLPPPHPPCFPSTPLSLHNHLSSDVLRSCHCHQTAALCCVADISQYGTAWALMENVGNFKRCKKTINFN